MERCFRSNGGNFCFRLCFVAVGAERFLDTQTSLVEGLRGAARHLHLDHPRALTPYEERRFWCFFVE